MPTLTPYRTHIFPHNYDAAPADRHSFSWVNFDSQTTEIYPGNDTPDKHRGIWWDTGHLYAGARTTWCIHTFRPVLNYAYRHVNFHNTPALPGGWNWGGGVSPLALDHQGAAIDDKAGTPYEGLILVLEPTGSTIEGLPGHQYHWTLVNLPRLAQAQAAGEWLTITLKIVWGNINLPIAGAVTAWLNDVDAPILNISGVNTIFVNDYRPESSNDPFGPNPGGGQRGITTWEGAYNADSTNQSGESRIDFLPLRIGRTPAEALNDGVNWPINTWSIAQHSLSYDGGASSFSETLTPVDLSVVRVPASVFGGVVPPPPQGAVWVPDATVVDTFDRGSLGVGWSTPAGELAALSVVSNKLAGGAAGTGAIPTLRATGTGVHVAGGSTAVINVPYPTLVAGDLLVMHIAEKNAAFPNETPTVPTGWTLQFSDGMGASPYIGMGWIFTKIATGSESGSLAVTFSGIQNYRDARMHSFAGASGIEGGNLYQSNNTTPALIPTLTTGGANRLGLAFLSHGNVVAPSDATGETGGNFTEAGAEYTGTVTLDLQTAAMASAGSITGGSIPFTGTATSYCTRVFALVPQASVPGAGAVYLTQESNPFQTYITLDTISGGWYYRWHVKNVARTAAPDTDWSGYQLRINPAGGSGSVQIQKWDGTTLVNLLTINNVSLSAQSKLGIEQLSDGTINVYEYIGTQWASLLGSITDTSYSSGYVAFALTDAVTALNDLALGVPGSGTIISEEVLGELRI